MLPSWDQPAIAASLREVDADSNRARNTCLPCNEAATLKHLDHLIHARCRHEKVLLDVGFGRRPAKVGDVFGDEGEVLPLPLGGLGGRAFRGRSLRILEGGKDHTRTCFNDHGDAIRKMKAQALLSLDAGMQDLLALQRLR